MTKRLEARLRSLEKAAADCPYSLVAFEQFFLRCCGTRVQGIRQRRWLDGIADLLSHGYADDEIRRVLRVRRGTKAAEDLAKVLAACRRLMDGETNP